ncbi:hypothetical protein [Streptomyces sp. NPDC048436]|uniref:hypothetical protein n=1 Tax=Streptomyces sp. NPDC048436 TaxID=3365550 RepID=UPI00371A05E0
MNLDDDATAEYPRAVLLPVLTLAEAHDLLPLLASVRDRGDLDREAAAYLLANLTARVPSLDRQGQHPPSDFVWHGRMELYAFVGFMVHVAAILEMRLQFLINHLSEAFAPDSNKFGASSRDLVKRAKSAAESNRNVTEAEKEELEALLDQVGPLMARRHGYVHGVWAVNQSDPHDPFHEAMRFTKNEDFPVCTPLSVDDVRDLIDHLSALAKQLTEWWVQRVEKSRRQGSA